MTALVVLEAVVIALLVVLVAGLLRSHAEILRRLHALGAGDDAGSPLPVMRRGDPHQVPVTAITGRTPGGAATTVALEHSRGRVLLAFLTTGCNSCRPLWEGLATLQMPSPDIRLVVVTRGPEEESPAAVSQPEPGPAKVVMSTEAWDACKVPVAPYFLLVDAAAGTTLGEGASGSWPQVFSLLGTARDDEGHRRTAWQTTQQRLTDTDTELQRAGIEPLDPSLFRRPADGGSQ